MVSPYIQNLINTKQQGYTASVAKTAAPQGSKEGMQNKSSLKPEKPKGYIVDENIVQSAGSSVTGLAKTGVYFVNAMNGKGTDYTVGRINDGARVLGSLGIAAALASTARSPKAKIMEFVGFTTWFGTMALWPKLLGTAIKATKGVDINQEYVDSYGRRKGFYEDAQYITWDLYKDKDLYKMGDKLGVPKNIENRKDAIKDKAKQVSIQGNTLMMLTAGIATPIGTALICNALDNPVNKAIELRTAEKELEKLSETGLMSTNKKGLEQLDSIIGTGETVNLGEGKLKQLKEFFGNQFDGVVGSKIQEQLDEHVTQGINLDEKAKEGFRKAFMLPDEVIKTFAGGSEETAQKLKKALTIGEDVFEENVIKEIASSTSDIKGIKPSVRTLMASSLRENGLGKSVKVDPLADAIIENLEKEAEKHKVTSGSRKFIKGLFEVADDFEARKIKIGKFEEARGFKMGKLWEKLSVQLPDILEMDKKTRTKIATANSPDKAFEYIFEHMQEVVKDENKLNRITTKYAKLAEEVVGKESEFGEKLTSAWKQVGAVSGAHAKDYGALGSSIGEFVETQIRGVDKSKVSTESSLFRPFLAIGRLLEHLKDPNAVSKDVVKTAMAELKSDFWSNKREHHGTQGIKGFGEFVNKVFAPITNILNENPALRDRINKLHKRIMVPLCHIDGANHKVSPFEHSVFKDFSGKDCVIDGIHYVWDGNAHITRDASGWGEKAGESFVNLVKNACKEKNAKKGWLGKVLMIAAPTVAVSLVAISQFGKKNKYNPDIYEVKKNK